MTDNYLEHELHDKEIDPNCSTCWSESFMLKQSMDKIYRQRKTREEVVGGWSKLRNINGCSPWDSNPLE